MVKASVWKGIHDLTGDEADFIPGWLLKEVLPF